MKEEIVELKKERDEFKALLFKTLRLTPDERKVVMPPPVGGFETAGARRVRLERERRVAKSGDPFKKGWTKDQVEELENEVLGVQEQRPAEETDASPTEDSVDVADSTKH